MLKVEQLKNLQDTSNTAIRTMENAVEKLNALIVRHEADTSRSQSFIIESVKSERDKMLPILVKELAIVREAAKESSGQLKFWESRSLLLSLQTFNDDPSKDAQIRLSHAAELATVPLPLLNITFENARADANLPLVYQCWRAGIGRTNEAGFKDVVDMSIDGLDIPDQAASLAAISVCASNVGHAESIAAVASGMRQDPLRKMNVARQQQATSRLVSAASGVANAA